MKKIIFILGILIFAQKSQADLKNTAVLKLLDKITAQSQTILAPVGEVFAFGTLDIRVDRCDKTPPEDKPESGAFISVTEIKNDNMNAIFTGWIFASNPSINSMEHAVYDIWVIDCK